MRPLRLSDIVDLETYERIRPEYRSRVLDHKQARRVSVGPRVSLVFEDRETLRYQILEMTRVERTTDPEKVQAEIDVYNDLVPGPNELSATLFIEIPELDQIRTELDRLLGIDECVLLVIDAGTEHETHARARFDDRQLEEDRISAVHYLRFSLSAAQVARFETSAGVCLRIHHPHYRHETELSPATRASLLRDLQDAAPVLLDARDATRVDAGRVAGSPHSARVRARELPPLGSRLRFVVETTDAEATLLGTDAAVLAELLTLAQQVAREVYARAGRCRIEMGGSVDAKGGLRFEIGAADEEPAQRAPSERGRREPPNA